MATSSMRDLDHAFQGAGQKAGLEIWRIENFNPVSVPKSLYGKFFTGDVYIILKTTATKGGALRHDIHYWLGKDASQDESGTAAIKTVELDAVLGRRAVQYREVQGNETEKFLSYFKPCIIPQKGGVASGFWQSQVNENEHETSLYVCHGQHVVYVKEVPFARSSLNHDDVFILDAKSKIFQFNGSNSSIQERAKALEVVQFLKDTYHDGKCEVAAVEDGRLMADADAGEFWALFGGFAPLPKRAISEDGTSEQALKTKLLCLEKGKPATVDIDPLTKELLESNKCYILDCGIEVFVWIGKNTPLDDRKSAGAVAEEIVRGRDKAHVVRSTEGFETVMFRSKFDVWPETCKAAVAEEGHGKVAALLKLQGLDIKGLMKSEPVVEDPDPFIDCTGSLQSFNQQPCRAAGRADDDSNDVKLFSKSMRISAIVGGIYVGCDSSIVYLLLGRDQGGASTSTFDLTSILDSETVKDDAVSAECELFDTILSIDDFDSHMDITLAITPPLQSWVVTDGVQIILYPVITVTTFYGYRMVWCVNGQEKTLLSSSDQAKLYTGDCYIFQYAYPGDNCEEYLIGTWFGKKSIEEDRAAAISIASKMVLSYKSQAVQTRVYEGNEPLQFCVIFQSFIVLKGGLSSGYKKFVEEKNVIDDTYTENGTALFRVQGSGPDNMQAIQVDAVATSLNSSCCFILHNGDTLYTWSGSLTTSQDQDLLERQLDLIKYTFNFQSLISTVHLLLAILNLGATPYVVCQTCSTNHKKMVQKLNSFGICLVVKESTPIKNSPGNLKLIPTYLVAPFQEVKEVFNFTQDDLMTEDIFILNCHSDIFIWVGQQVDNKRKSDALNIGEMHGNSYQRKLALVKHGATPILDKSKRRVPRHSGRSLLPDKSERPRSASFSPDRVRLRGRSPAFNALAATFENPNARNLSTPPPAVNKLYPKSSLSDTKLAPRSATIAALTASFESTKESMTPKLSRDEFQPLKYNNLFVFEVSFAVNRVKQETAENGSSPLGGGVDNLIIQDDTKELQPEDEGLQTFPYEGLITSSTDPVAGIDVTKREAYLSSAEFKEKFNMPKSAFYKLPKWKQNKLKMAVHLF
ncbi:Villin-4 [Apostasia shenzhenica]|uniref:Villin-4 n=1 Tax=Apostasia shenzhenica TaxID=1088818 RepID=A0A2I0A1S5_9ASPA|nr:Villin-4 [Apostasia shenzhenica]